MDSNPAYGYGRRNTWFNARRNTASQSNTSTHDPTLVDCYQGDGQGTTHTEDSSNAPAITTIVNPSADTDPTYAEVHDSTNGPVAVEIGSETSLKKEKKIKDRQGILILLVVILMATVLFALPAMFILLAIMLNNTYGIIIYARNRGYY